MKILESFLACSLLLVAAAGFADDAKSLKDYKAEAMAAVDSVTAREAAQYLGDDEVVFIDVREQDEIDRLGKIDGALHVPRGILEFVIDPKGPMHDDVFNSGKTLIFYCATDGRSMLAAKLASDMGVADARYIKGGYRAWSRTQR